MLGSVLTFGSSDTFIGAGAGSSITTGSNDMVLGAGTFQSGSNCFGSNDAVFGNNAFISVAANLVLWR